MIIIRRILTFGTNEVILDFSSGNIFTETLIKETNYKFSAKHKIFFKRLFNQILKLYMNLKTHTIFEKSSVHKM